MKQVIQDLKSGDTILEDVPTPLVKNGTVLIKTRKSLVSLGTERMLVEFGKANLVQKAKQQPEKVKMVLDKIKTDGLLPTLETVFNKLNQPMPLGYCNVGEVIAVGDNVTGIQIGDRVASNGSHAEYVVVPENLAAKIPDDVTDSQATFTVIGSIGLQGIRLLNPTFNETIVVIGLGLIGQITAQLLLANGCKVIGFDYDPAKIRIAKDNGVNAIDLSTGIDPVRFVDQATNSIGADGVIITASNKSNEIITQAAQISRKRGKIVLVGVIGLNLSRVDFYEKELSFQVSCSYGPGRYDENYEQKGIDYPLPYVRWTEKRNFESILTALEKNALNVNPLITEEIPLSNYLDVYNNIGNSNSIASILVYDDDTNVKHSIPLEEPQKKGSEKSIGIIGAGNFTNATILPALKKVQAPIKFISSAGGLNSRILSKKFKIDFATTDYKQILDDQSVELVVISTRHNTHSKFVVEALNNGKHVFVEKPLAITEEGLNDVIEAKKSANKSVVVGFNRRFSPHIRKIKNEIGNGEINVVATMNAGHIPQDMWVHDMDIGGGRIIGEACHYIDLLVYLTGSKVISVCTNALGKNPQVNTDNVSILLKFENGSNATINYFSNGSKSYSKEKIEVFSQGKVFVCDNFRITNGFGSKKLKKFKTRQDKGHNEQFKRLNDFVRKGGDPIISFDEIVNVSSATLKVIKSLQTGIWENV